MNYKINIYLFISFLILFSFSAMAFYYGYKVHSSFIRADEWRFLEIFLIPFYDGTFSWKMLFADQHGNPLDGLIFIVNAIYFDLAGDLFFYIGIIFKILILMLFSIILRQNFSDNTYYNIFALIIISTTFFSLKGTMEYQWPLVTRGNLFIFIFIFILYYVDIYLKNENQNTKSFLLIFLLSFLLILSIKTAGFIFLSSFIGVLFILFVVDKNLRVKFFKLIILFIFVIALINIIWFLFAFDTTVEASNKIDFINFSILSFVQSYGLALLSGLVNVTMISKKIGTSSIILFSYLYILIYSFVIFYSIKLKTYKKSIVPLALMSYPLLFILGVLLYRYFPVHNEINWLVISPRYVSTYELGTIGLIWNILLIFYSINLSKFKRLVFIFLGVSLIILNLAYMKYSFATSKSFINAFSNADKKFYNYSGDKDSLPKWLKGGHFSDEKVDFLKKHKLNIFSDKYNMIDKR